MKKNMDGYCILCANYGPLEQHHLVPKAHGGSDEPTNIVYLCKPCHRRRAHVGYERKNDRVLREARMISPLIRGREIINYYGIANSRLKEFRKPGSQIRTVYWGGATYYFQNDIEKWISKRHPSWTGPELGA